MAAASTILDSTVERYHVPTHVLPDRYTSATRSTVLTPVDGAFDFREPRRIGATEIDHAFTGLAAEAGLVRVRVLDGSGAGVAMSWDTRCPWVQIHTADTPGNAATHRVGLVVEPMTCAPDAFNASRYPFDTGLLILQPGARTMASWRIEGLVADLP